MRTVQSLFRAARNATAFVNRLFVTAVLSLCYGVVIGTSFTLLVLFRLFTRKRVVSSFWEAPDRGDTDPAAYRSAY